MCKRAKWSFIFEFQRYYNLAYIYIFVWRGIFFIFYLLFIFLQLTEANPTVFPLAHFLFTLSLSTLSSPNEGLITRWLLHLWICFVEQTCCGWKILRRLISCTLSLAQHGLVRTGDEFVFPLLPCVSRSQLELCTQSWRMFESLTGNRDCCEWRDNFPFIIVC